MFTAKVEFAIHGINGVRGTRYCANVIHADEAGRQQHTAMGFEGGWGTALGQLVAMVKKGI